MYRGIAVYHVRMAGIFQISDFGELLTQNAAVSFINGMLTSSSAATSAAASAITPPGGEGASALAVAQQVAAVEQFGAMFQLGMEQLMERVASTEMFSATSEATNALNAASFAI